MDDTTNDIHPLHLSKFKNLGPCTPNTVIDIPEKIENRVATDTCFLIFFIVCVILLMPFLIYTWMGSDIRRLGKIDDCGNVCGDTNIKYEQSQCTGQNFTDKNREVGRLCISEENPDRYETGLKSLVIYRTVIWKIILGFLISVGVSVVVVYLFRCSVAVMAWAIILCLFILCSIVVGIIWLWYIFDGNAYILGTNYYIPIIVSSLSTLFLLIYIAAAYFLRSKIKLVILLLKETIAAIRAVPSLVIVPIFTFIASCTIVILSAIATVYLTEDSLRELRYRMTTAQLLIIIFNFIITIWALYFVDGLQYMITAGVVSEWYFAKDKTNLMKPLKNMATIVCKYHLGTIAFGSIILLIAHIVHFSLKSILRRFCTNACTCCWIKCAKSLLDFVTKRTYIMTVMHGQPFYQSGKRAANLIIGNVCNITTVIVIGAFIFGATIFIIAVLSVLLSICLFLSDIEDNNMECVMALTAIFWLAVSVGVTFISLFKTTTDTIFMCFYEDSILNDGMSRPYAMSTNLIKFIEKSKKPTVHQSFIRSDSAILDTKI